MKYLLLLITIAFALISFATVSQYSSFDENTLENKKNYNQRHNGFDNTHKTLTHQSKINEKTHAEIGQFQNSYQESAYQYISALYNKIDSIHHKFEIVRHGKDPFLQTDAKYFDDVNVNLALSSVDHYERKYESYMKQTVQFLSDTPALKDNVTCENKEYYKKPTFNLQCLDSCDCTGSSICNNMDDFSECTGNTNQTQTFDQIQQVVVGKIYTTYFMNFLTKYHMNIRLSDIEYKNGKKGVNFDEKALIETADNLYEFFYQLQQLSANPKYITGNGENRFYFDLPTFTWIAQQAKDAFYTQLKVGQIEQLELILKEIDILTKDLAKQISDPNDLSQWQDLMAKNTVIPDENYQFGEIQSYVQQFLNQGHLYTDNYGDYISFSDLLKQMKENQFNPGNISDADEAQILSLGCQLHSVIYASLRPKSCQ